MKAFSEAVEKVLVEIPTLRTAEECYSHIFKIIEATINFANLAIVLKSKQNQEYIIKNHRNLSHSFVKSKSFFPDDDIFIQLSEVWQNQTFKYLRTQNHKYMLENQAYDYFIFPLRWQTEIHGFFHIDKDKELFTQEEINKLTICGSIMNMITQLYHLEHEISTINEHESITGLLNHRAFRKRCHTMIDHLQRYDHSASIGILKIGKFEELVSVVGNHKIPVILQNIAKIIKEELRLSDIAGVLFPDTIAVLFPETASVHAKTVIERMNEKFKSITEVDNLFLHWGISGTDNKDFNFDKLLREAIECATESLKDTGSCMCIIVSDLNK